MTARRRLAWYTIAVLSIILTVVAVGEYGEYVLEADRTGLSAAIVLAYLVMTVWLGVAIHGSRLGRAVRWARYVEGLLPALGLLGTFAGIIILFGLQGEGMPDDPAALLSGMGTALFTSFTGLVYSMAIEFQLMIVRGGTDD